MKSETLLYTVTTCERLLSLDDTLRALAAKRRVALSSGLVDAAADLLVRWGEFKDERHLVILCASEGELAAYKFARRGRVS